MLCGKCIPASFVSLIRHAIPMGLHANLSEGLPVCQELRRSTLINKSGVFHGKMGFRDVLRSGKMCMADVRRTHTTEV